MIKPTRVVVRLTADQFLAAIKQLSDRPAELIDYWVNSWRFINYNVLTLEQLETIGILVEDAFRQIGTQARTRARPYTKV